VSQLLAGLDHLWQSDIVHRDLKPENILADFSGADLRIKLCDFGLSTPFQGGDTLRDFCGSPGFYAPECTTHNSYCGRKADLFSIGAIVLELLSGATYFRDEWLSAYRLVKSGNATHFRNEIKNSIDAAHRLVNDRYPPDIARAATSMINYTAVMRPEIHYLRQRNSWISHGGSAANKLDVLAHLNAGDKAVIHHFDRIPRGATKRTVNLRKKPALPNIGN
jgi:serine/threonine protein kinase